jgi:hypothetical protein
MFSSRICAMAGAAKIRERKRARNNRGVFIDPYHTCKPQIFADERKSDLRHPRKSAA